MTNSLEAIAVDMQRRVGFTPEYKICFSDVGKFETTFNVKVVVFYRDNDGQLLHYQRNDTRHDIEQLIFTYMTVTVMGF